MILAMFEGPERNPGVRRNTDHSHAQGPHPACRRTRDALVQLFRLRQTPNFSSLHRPGRRPDGHGSRSRSALSCSSGRSGEYRPVIVTPSRRPIFSRPEHPSARYARTGLSIQMVIEGRSATARQPNRSLLRLIGQARHFQNLVISKDGCSFRELAARVGVSPTYFTQVFQLSFLAPDITTAILQGRQPTELSAIQLMRAGHIEPRLGKAAASTWLRPPIAPDHERGAANTAAERLFAEDR